MADEFEMELQEHLKNLEPHIRDAYIPQTQEVAADASAQSKYGGFPYLTSVYDWPRSPESGNPMQFFLQIKLNDLPLDMGTGLFQFFYCLESYQVVCRIIPDIEAQKGDGATDVQYNPYPQKAIIAWEKRADYPDREDYWDLDIEEIEDEVDMLMDEKNVGEPYQGDKLLGWAAWEQEPSYPSDDISGREMKLFFQLTSNEHLPHMFGDDGKCYIYFDQDEDGTLKFKSNEAGG